MVRKHNRRITQTHDNSTPRPSVHAAVQSNLRHPFSHPCCSQLPPCGGMVLTKLQMTWFHFTGMPVGLHVRLVPPTQTRATAATHRAPGLALAFPYTMEAARLHTIAAGFWAALPVRESCTRSDLCATAMRMHAYASICTLSTHMQYTPAVSTQLART